ncbi:hypothetical protein [Mangrovibacterium marinum]|uniref:Uncharacterized protein n=1 Tax=Mangrovibacterium marinum TaxID=1639118 RepID=A0A2T5C530_9BACT|nr:hypothetical protein [Mangrovibacterium marinum]PTN09961.1 hypothetical protein C8N47_103258 [Mangrovibacterium marinum]
MENNRIKELLDRYFDGQSSLSEEQELHAYFSSGEIDAEFLPYAELFNGVSELQQDQQAPSEEQLMDYILEHEHREKSKIRYLWQTVSSIAAALLIALLVYTSQQDKTHWDDSFNDPNIAYAEATKTLHFVAAKYQAGMGQLKPVAKVSQAVKPLDNSLQRVNKGFQQVEELKQINEKLKQQ